MAELQDSIREFERSRGQLVNLSAQKQQMSFHLNMLNASLDELKKTKEKKVYKAAGNILILSDTGTVRKELAEQKDSVELRLKTLQKQEDAIIEKLNKLKSQIEKAGQPAQAVQPEEEKKNKEEK